MTVDPDTFRAVLSQWPSGVTVVTTLAAGKPHGMTASSFTSVSLDPPLVSVCIARHVTSHDLIAESGNFAVSILGKDQIDHGKRFAGMLDLEDRFEGLDVETATTGAPVLPDALGWLDCEVWAAYDGGDHTIFVGEVKQASANGTSAPLLYHARNWGQVADVLPTRVTVTLVDGQAAGARTVVSADELPAKDAPGPVIAACDSAADIERSKSNGAGAVELTYGVSTPERLIRLAHDLALPVRFVVQAAFGTDEALPAEDVAAAANAALALGPDELVLDDGPGAADPLTVREVLQQLAPIARPTPVGLRAAAGPFASANVLTALKSGVTHLDVALGADTYVPAADVVAMLDKMQIESGLDRADLA